MTEETGLRPAEGEAGTTMYRPSAEGGLEAAGADEGDYRDHLRSRRWDAAPLEPWEVAELKFNLYPASVVIKEGHRGGGDRRARRLGLCPLPGPGHAAAQREAQ